MFGVYVHFPYCRQRCPYCDFAVKVQRTIPHERYLQAITAELDARSALFAGRRAVSVYFGGGTPSLWLPACIARLRDLVLQRFPPPPGPVEVTLECDPADLSAGSLRELRAAGVNRLSLGVQSLQDRHLVALGRQHTAAQALAAFARCREAGFDNISVDLMIGLIDQTPAELRDDLDGLLGLRPEHLSLYQLTVEPGTPLHAAVERGRTAAPREDQQADAYLAVRAVLREAGYAHYEISSYARIEPGRDLRAVHNRLYWTGGEYLGLGVSAHSFRRLPEGAGERFASSRSTTEYLDRWAPEQQPPHRLLQQEGLALHEVLQRDALRREALWLGLRQIDGISRAGFAAAHGVDPVDLGGVELQLLQSRGLLEVDLTQLRLSDTGVLFADEVGAALIA